MILLPNGAVHLPKMSESRAHEIVDACFAHFMYREGLREEFPPSLQSYSLQELLDANHLVRDAGSAKNADGSSTISMVCDDRLIAALYVLYHYHGSDPHDPDILASTPFGRKVVVVVRVPEEAT